MGHKNAKELYAQRVSRIKRAIALEAVDRVPVTAWMDTFAAHYRKVPTSVFHSDITKASKAIVETLRDFPTFDALEAAATPVRLMGKSFMSRVKMPGKELPEGSLFQIEEVESLSIEDFDRILQMGWPKFSKEYNARLGYTGWQTFTSIVKLIFAAKRMDKAGFPQLSGIFYVPPLESIAAGRSIGKFMTDLHRVPDKLAQVLDHMEEFYLADLKKQIRQTKPLTVFLGISRGSSEFVSPKLFNRFTWPVVLKAVEAIIEAGSVPNLHFDANWDRDIARFKDLPKGKCVWACDHATDIYKLKESLDGHMCIKGDVPATLLSLGSPEEVYKYCRKLITDMGPKGFILSPGCTLPPNARVENVKAMLAAVEG